MADYGRWVVRTFEPIAPKLRLFCFPYAGGGASIFRQWGIRLADYCEVYAVQLPGRENRRHETPYTDIDKLATTLADFLIPMLDRPYAFFGHSMGALVCFELARVVRRRQGPQPDHLFLSAREGPQCPRLYPPIAHLPEAQFVAQLQARYRGIPPLILNDPDLLKIFLTALRADFHMIEAYVYQEEDPLAVPITVYGGSDELCLTDRQLEGWRHETAKAFQLCLLPGGHFFLTTHPEPLWKALAKDMMTQPPAF